MQQLADKVNEHDRHIDRLSQALENLSAVTEKMSEAILTISVLIEKFNNLEINLTESFGRFHNRIELLEDTHSGEGCGTLKVQNEKITSLGRSLDTVRDNLVLSNKVLHKDISTLEADMKSKINTGTIMWGVGIYLTAMFGLGVYLSDYLNSLEDTTKAHIVKSNEVCPNIKERLVKIEDLIHAK